MSRFQHVLHHLYGMPWAIVPDKYEQICRVVEDRITAGAGASDFAGGEAPEYSVQDGVALIPVYGTIAKRMNLFMAFSGGASTELLARTITAALDDPKVGAIVLDIDSPGGMVDGTATLSDMIFCARAQKPIVAFANGLMASAAYWIGSSAETIFANQTAEVGSIGVIMSHVDRTKANEKYGYKVTVLRAGKYKALGHPDTPLDEEATAELQASINQIYGMFVDTVARNRGVDSKDVAEQMAEGRVFIGQRAKDAGLVDQIGELSDAIAFARSKVKGAARTAQGGMRMEKSFSDSVRAALEGRVPEIEEHREIAASVIEQVRSFDRAKATGQPNPADQARDAERQRACAIVEAGGKAGVSVEFAVGLVREGATVEAALGKIIDRAAETQKGVKTGKEPETNPVESDTAEQARNYAAEHKCSFAEALIAVSKPASKK